MNIVKNIYANHMSFNLSIIKLMEYADPVFVVPLTVAIEQFELLPSETLSYVHKCTGQSIESILAKTAEQLDCNYTYTDSFAWSLENKVSIPSVTTGNVIVSVDDSDALEVTTSLVKYALVVTGGYSRGYKFDVLPVNELTNIILTPQLHKDVAEEVVNQVEEYIANGGTPERRDNTRLIEARNLDFSGFKLVLVDQ